MHRILVVASGMCFALGCPACSDGKAVPAVDAAIVDAHIDASSSPPPIDAAPVPDVVVGPPGTLVLGSTVALADPAAGMAYDPARDRLDVTGNGLTTRTGLSIVVPETATVETTVPLSEGAFGVAANPTTGKLYVATPGGTYAIDAASGLTLSKIPTATTSSAAVAVAVDASPNRIYVANDDTSVGDTADSMTITIIDGGSDQVVGTMALPQARMPLGSERPGAESWLAVDETSHTLYALARNDMNFDYDRLFTIDTPTGDITAVLDGADSPDWMVYDAPDQLLVVSGEADAQSTAFTLHVLAVAGGPHELAPIATGITPHSGSLVTGADGTHYLGVAGVDGNGLVALGAYSWDGQEWQQRASGASQALAGVPYLSSVTYANGGDRMEAYAAISEVQGGTTTYLLERLVLALP